MADIDRPIGFMTIMQVPFMNDPDALAYIEEVKTVLKQAKAQADEIAFLKRMQQQLVAGMDASEVGAMAMKAMRGE